MITQDELKVRTLGERRFRSPLPLSTEPEDGVGDFMPDDMRVLADIRVRVGPPSRGGPDASEGQGGGAARLAAPTSFELAGAREKIFFEPKHTRAAVVTCGGLCPGLNNVIRTLYFESTKNYGIHEVIGIRFGYQGLDPKAGQPPVSLTSKMVEGIHMDGGTILGTSRGPVDPAVAVDFLTNRDVNILFCIGGDGTQRGAHAIFEEVARRKLPISVIGIPKTIDNDIRFCRRSFGFATAVEEANKVIHRAHTEAISVSNGIGLVKLMGREAGYIAAGATIVSGDVNFTLIPEVPLELEGECGLLPRLERRLEARNHAVIVVAEGAGQDLLAKEKEEFDASGNRKLGDVGVFLKDRISKYFGQRKIPVNVRYFDPSYHIRSCRANTVDSLLCEQLARHAVHAGMAGKTDTLIGLVHGEFVHVPLPASIGQKKRMSPEDEWWMAVLAITGQEKW